MIVMLFQVTFLRGLSRMDGWDRLGGIVVALHFGLSCLCIILYLVWSDIMLFNLAIFSLLVAFFLSFNFKEK